MTRKIYYDSVNNKEVVDLTGTKNEATVKSDFGLDVTTQVITVDPALNEKPELVAGVLQKFDYKVRNDAAEIARESSRQGKETSIKAKLSLTDQDFADLKEALG